MRVLQYRSVAFVTYVSEYNAQFAKEAMACQSLDNDEILNVRWATEDPNPVQKVAEKRRLESIGQEAIKARMDPSIVDAMRAVRRLEEGEEGDNDTEMGDRVAKRARFTLEDKGGNDHGEEEDEATPPPPLPQPPQISHLQPRTGLLSADTLEGLKYFAEIKQRLELNRPLAKLVPPAPKPTGLGLAAYGSDDDD